MRTIFETSDKVFRITEHLDATYDIKNLKGDCFNAVANPDIDPIELKRQESKFEALVANEGAYGYVLERWNSAPGIGYKHVDSCWGFVGQYDPLSETFNHYIVDEMKITIAKEVSNEKHK